VSKIRPDALSIPSSLRVYPTTSWFPGDVTIPGESDHLRNKGKMCPVCSGWQSNEKVVVWKKESGAVQRTVVRCHGPRDRSVARCAPQVVDEVPLADYTPNLS
jgi:hypothetical protein